MNALSLFPFFVAGLVGSVHCVGMCGGIVSAFSMATSAASRASSSRTFSISSGYFAFSWVGTKYCTYICSTWYTPLGSTRTGTVTPPSGIGHGPCMRA